MTDKTVDSPSFVGEPRLIVVCECGARAQKVLDTAHGYLCTRCGNTFEHKTGTE